MVEIIGVRFSNAGKIYYFDPQGEEIALGKMVIVETARGVEMGRVSIPNRQIPDEEITAPLKPIIRIATEEDMNTSDENKIKEKEAFKIAAEMIREHKLGMKLIDVEYTFDRSKILFYFTADGRVDFRELVKSLAGVFRTRIELRQIGVRDEARQLGSIGICGRALCCSTFLDDFRPVSIKMAKEQGLSLNPTKISGVCGRLMCCLQYEQAAYEDALKTMPAKGASVETIDGTGTVVEAATLKQQIRVKLDGEEGHKTEIYKVGEFNIVGKEPTVSLEELKVRKEEEAMARAAGLLDEENLSRTVADTRFDDNDSDSENSQKNTGGERRGRRKNGNNKRRVKKAPSSVQEKNGGKQNSDPKKSEGGGNSNKRRRRRSGNSGQKKQSGGYTQQQ